MTQTGSERSLRVGNLFIEEFDSAGVMGEAAGSSETIGVIFDPGVAQTATIDILTSIPILPEVSTQCPTTIMRNHSNTTVYSGPGFGC
jgi:hypothetical protein